MKLSSVTLRRQILAILTLLLLWGSGLITVPALAADEWTIYRHEGRDYVSLENIATFYGFPAPPPLTALQAPANTGATIDGAATAALQEKAATPATLAIVDVTPGQPIRRTINLDNGKYQLAVTTNSRESVINGVKQWLAFPTLVQEEKVMISRLDLAKIIEPKLRPEKIAGLRPVTTIVLDPGHGGHDKGAASKFGFEKNFALDVSLRARNLLEAKGYKVVMTRTADIFIPLHERPAVANRIADSIFVSIHFNSTGTNPLARGFEIYSLAPRGAPATNDAVSTARDLREEPGNAVDTPSAALANSIYHSMLGHVPVDDRGLKHARFAVLRLARVPSTLIECGFVSNSAESALIGSEPWRQKVAESIVTGIVGYKELAEQRLAPRMVADYRKASAAAANGTPPTAN